MIDASHYQPPRMPSKNLARADQKDPGTKPSQLPPLRPSEQIISLIHEPAVTERMLRHLGLSKQQTAPTGRKARAPEHGPVVIEDFDDGWPGYEEPIIVFH
jgi:hypothetical protein